MGKGIYFHMRCERNLKMSRRIFSLSLVFFLPLVALGSAIVLVLSHPIPVLATPPIGGGTHDFSSALGVGGISGNLLALAAGDIDNNGTRDVAYAEGSSLVIRSNDGAPFDGWPSAVTIASAGQTIRDLVLADFDRDGYLDVAAVTGGGSSGNQVTLWRNPGTSPFGGVWSTSNSLASGLGYDLLAVAVGDLDNDGWLDLAVADANGALHLWRNPFTRTGDFTTSWTPLNMSGGSNAINDIALADLDGDGALDLVTVRGGGVDRVQIWRNDGTPFAGSWTSVALGSGPLAGDGLSLALGDWDRDGDTDIASGDGAGNVIVWQNPGVTAFSGTWGSGNDIGDAAGAVNALMAADLDDDGDLDLLSGAEATTHSVQSWQNPWQGPGDNGPFNGAWSLTFLDNSDASVNVLATGDLDNDYDIDIMYGQDNAGGADELQIVQNTLVGRQVTPFAGIETALGWRAEEMQAVLTVDLDGDGDLDVVSAGRDNTIVARENDGTPFQGGSPSYTLVNNAGSDVYALAAGDLDNDGDMDLVSGQYGSPRIQVWENDGTPFNGLWNGRSIGSSLVDPVMALELADLDFDGYLDLVSGNGYKWPHEVPSRKVVAWRNDRTPFNGDWVYNDIAVVTVTVYSLAVGDLDNDGNLDVVAGLGPATAVLDGTQPSTDTSLYADLYELRAFQGDETPFSGLWPESNLGRDPETVTFAAGRYHGYWGTYIYEVKLADLDNDGDLDIVTAEDVQADYQVKAWENDGTPFSGELWSFTAVAYNEPPKAPWLDGSVFSVDVGDVNQDGFLDVLSGSQSWETNELKIWENSGVPFGAYITDTTWVRHNLAEIDANLNRVRLADLDRDGDLDAVGVSNVRAGAEVMAWQNRGGSVAEVATPQAPATLANGATDDFLRIVASHRGRVTDHAIELAKWRLHLVDGGGNPLTSAQANALIENLAVYYSPDGTWEVSDTLMLTVPDLALTNGVQTILFADGDSLMELAPSVQKNYFVVITLTPDADSHTPNSFQIIFDADSDSVVEDRTTDTSVIVQDTGPVSSGTVNNIAPVAVISGTYSGYETTPIAFDGSASWDANNDPLIYTWQFGDGSTGSGSTPAHAYAAIGTYVVTLTVEDPSSLTGVDTTTVTIQDMIPVAEAGGPYIGGLSETITFDGSQSQGDVMTYTWDLDDDGIFETEGVTATAQFAAEGSFTVTLQVEDDDGWVRTDQAQVTISAADQRVFLPLILK
jgi:hypothetical protein